MEVNRLYCIDAIELLKGLEDYSADIIFTDPPYALGSEVIIRKDGKPDYKKAVDFMNKWDQPDGAFWETWFKEAFRVLKYGGRVVMFGMDRQLMLNKYYACFAGFIEQQSLYWYFISNFPKASDLSKNIDKVGGSSLKWFIDYVIEYAEEKGITKKQLTDLFLSKKGNATGWLYNKSSGRQSLTIEQYNKIRDFLVLPFNKIEEVEREIVGLKSAGMGSGKTFGMLQDGNNTNAEKILDITAPSSDLAKKYDGYKYSIAPLKQTCETIMVFQKPYKTGSCLHDTLAYENGDQQTLCGALDIDGERVGVDGGGNHGRTVDSDIYGKFGPTEKSNIPTGRYPSQTFVDSEAGEILDRQSGNLTSGKAKIGTGNIDNQEGGIYGSGKGGTIMSCFAEDKRGCSKILHHCDYDKEEFDLFIYCPKVSKSERNFGLDSYVTIKYLCTEFKNYKIWQEEIMGLVELLKKVISALSIKNFNIAMCGESITVQCQKDSLSIIKTEISKITESKILNLLQHLTIKESTQDVSYEMEYGGNHARSVEILNQLILKIGICQKKDGLNMENVASAIYDMLLRISNEENWQGVINNHCTLKPLSLIRHILKLFKTPNPQLLIDSFAGSGTILMIAKELEIDYIGSELQPEYCEIAEARLKSVNMNQQLTLF